MDDQSGSSSGVIATEDIAEHQAHESQKTEGESSERRHKKKKKTKSKEVIIDLVDSSGPSEGGGGVEPVGGAEEGVAGGHSEKRKSKKRHKAGVASDSCHDSEEAMHESKAKRKKMKTAKS